MTEGSIRFQGKYSKDFGKVDLAGYRKCVQAVFQNPFSSLDPKMHVGAIISEPLLVNRTLEKKTIRYKMESSLEMVGLDAGCAKKFPHEFSGGQRQRIAIARALACDPRLIILDEPVSSQDVSIRAQLLNLLKDLQQRLGVSFLFIAHDLATMRYMSHRVSVMYLGKIVECATSDELCTQPLHPYTKALFSASLPDRPDSKQVRTAIVGEVPSPLNPPAGCRFHTRCPDAREMCSRDIPLLKEVRPNHSVACVLYEASPTGSNLGGMDAVDGLPGSGKVAGRS